MGFLRFFSKSSSSEILRLPNGSFTLDRHGHIIASTLPQRFPAARLRQIGQGFLATFQSAREANMPLSELVVNYASLKLTARELRGGAIVFLAPQGFAQSSSIDR